MFVASIRVNQFHEPPEASSSAQRTSRIHADRFDITNKKLVKGVGSIHARKGQLTHEVGAGDHQRNDDQLAMSFIGSPSLKAMPFSDSWTFSGPLMRRQVFSASSTSLQVGRDTQLRVRVVAEYRPHLRSTNASELAFATVRNRTSRRRPVGSFGPKAAGAICFHAESMQPQSAFWNWSGVAGTMTCDC
jgi:hypothetical protein